MFQARTSPRITVLRAALLMAICVSGCSAKSQGEIDSYYYAGLAALKTGTEDQAVICFRRVTKEASPEVRRRALEELSRLRSPEERVKTAQTLQGEWPDDASRLRMAEELFAQDEYAKVIALTDGLGTLPPGAALAAGPREQASADALHPLTQLRIRSLVYLEREDAGPEIIAWFAQWPLTPSHTAFLTDIGESLEAILGEQESCLIRFREEVLARRYAAALKIIDGLLALQENAVTWIASLPPPVFSDAGRAAFYGAAGADTFLKWAALFDRVADAAPGTPAAFYALFYSGRLYDKAGKSTTETPDRLFRASKAAPDPNRRDDALWSYLNALLRDSTDTFLAGLRALAQNTPPLVPDNTSAFVAFFDNLSNQLLEQKKWDAYVSALPVVTQMGGAGIASKFAYVSGRLIEEGLAKGQGSAGEFFRAALGPGGDLYYQLTAGLRLGLTRAEMERLLLAGRPQDAAPMDAAHRTDAGVEAVLRAYAEHGLWERIYPEWLTVRPWIGSDTGFALAAGLENTADEAQRVQGLRMAVWYGRGNTAEQMCLQYTRFFREEIQQSAAEIALPDRLLFALVRSESFFRREVRSRVQAQGLTQLMAATAEGIAKSLGVTDYDVNDAATNVRFGAFYLAEQIRRQNGSVLEALYAYNAGPTRARTWRRRYPYPPDLFLELIPFAETRGYVRANTAAAAIYGWLYNDMNPLDVAAEMMK